MSQRERDELIAVLRDGGFIRHDHQVERWGPLTNGVWPAPEWLPAEELAECLLAAGYHRVPPSTLLLLHTTAAQLGENPAGQKLAAALRVVLERHSSDNDGDCPGCGVFVDGEPVRSPCALELAVRKELEP